MFLWKIFFVVLLRGCSSLIWNTITVNGAKASSWSYASQRGGPPRSSTIRQLSTSTSSGASQCGVDPGSLFGANGQDLVWAKMREDANVEASKEPLLASFMHGSILSHSSLERALAFHLANLLSSPAMSATQIQSLFLSATESSIAFRTSLRMDIKAVMERDPAVKTCPGMSMSRYLASKMSQSYPHFSQPLKPFP